jgi:hypothetical protein
MSAAASLRLPYWASDEEEVIPDIMKTEQVTVTNRRGVPVQVKNPFQAFEFHPALARSELQSSGVNVSETNTSLIHSFISLRLGQVLKKKTNPHNKELYADYTRTLRGTYNGSANASDYDRVQAMLSNVHASNGARLRKVFLGNDERSSLYATASEDIESIHGAVHNALLSFMIDLQVSAFDPAFFLHHANVDRQWAMWSAIHYNATFTDRPTCGRSFAQPATTQDGSSPLYPFHADAEGSFWTPETMWYTGGLGYSYDCVPDWRLAGAELAHSVRGYVANALPNPRKDFLRWMTTTAAGAGAGGHDGVVVMPSTRQEWLVDFTVHGGQSPGNIAVFFFLGEPGMDQQGWMVQDNMIIWQTFQQSSGESHGQVPITTHIFRVVQQGRLGSLATEDVKAFLKLSLQWRVLETNSKGQGRTVNEAISVKVLDQLMVSREDEELYLEYGPVHENSDLTWG